MILYVKTRCIIYIDKTKCLSHNEHQGVAVRFRHLDLQARVRIPVSPVFFPDKIYNIWKGKCSFI